MTSTSALIDPAATERFWLAIAHSSPTFVEDMAEAAAFGRATPEFEDAAALLHAIRADLLLILGPGQDGGLPEIVISAGGHVPTFPFAHAIVQAAPEAVRQRYTIHFLRPPVAQPEQMRVPMLSGREMTVTDIRWSATPTAKNSGVANLVLHVPGWLDALPAASVANERYASNALLLLDALVGEWAVEMQIAGVEWRSTRGAEDLPTLLDLPGYLADLAA